MKHRFFGVAFAAGCAALLASPLAHAAVTVLGNGLAEDCYNAAEYGGDPANGVQTCSLALDQAALSIRDRAATYVNRGILKARTSDTQGALGDYDAGLALDPDLAEGYVDRGSTLLAMKRYDEALAAINQGIDKGTKRPYIAYYDRAIANEGLGNLVDAYKDCSKAVELKPDFTLAKDYLARFKVVRQPASETPPPPAQ